ncbi:MAG: XdhC/CoxI family protein [Actinomycetota bacterium]
MSKEIRQIIEKLNSLGANDKAVLATVVDVRGSSYRLPGAKMLILENGDTFGTVSGGCLEADVLERARKVLQTGDASVFTYDTTQDENSVFSLNMGCRGVIQILLEIASSENNYLKFLAQSFDERRGGVVATLISKDKNSFDKSGSRFFYDSENSFTNELSEHLTEKIRADCQNAMREQKSAFRVYDEGTEVFLEFIKPVTSLLIFGAGADAIPLAEISGNLGWNISIADHRPAFLTAERFPKLSKLIPSNAENYLSELYFDEQTAAVIMTHNYERDREILSNLLKSNVFYIGALGPKRRTENLLNELSERGEIFNDEQLTKLHAPVGLDIGADTPEAIALSIAAEIQAVLKQRDGGFLRQRNGSIYGRN